MSLPSKYPQYVRFMFVGSILPLPVIVLIALTQFVSPGLSLAGLWRYDLIGAMWAAFGGAIIGFLVSEAA
jgi:hypothetical protein